MRASNYSGLLAAVLLVCVAPLACAEDGLPFTLSASYTVQSDSNLFRLPANADTTRLIGATSGAERVGRSTLGVRFDSTQSLQKFELDASLVDNQYQNFSYLNYTARNYTAAWRWALTPRLTGNFTNALQETLNSFSDYQGYRLRNQRADTSTRLDANYEIEGPWRLLAGVSQTKQTNQQVLLANSDYSNTLADLGLRHVFASGSAITYTTRIINGSYLNRTLSRVGLYDDSFKQLDNDLRLRWAIEGNSTADVYFTHIQRTHPNFAQRDYSGFNSGLTFNWAITGKSALGAGYSHELGAYATANTNYSQTDRITLGPVWQISSKTMLRLQHAWTQTDYLGSPTNAASSARRDVTRDTSVSLSWQANPHLSLSASLQNQSRGSNLAGLDYDSDSALFSAQLSY